MQQNVCTVGIELAKNIWAVSHDSREADRSTSRRSRRIFPLALSRVFRITL